MRSRTDLNLILTSNPNLNPDSDPDPTPEPNPKGHVLIAIRLSSEIKELMDRARDEVPAWGMARRLE